MKCLVILGTRPEAVKLAPVIRAMKLDPEIEVVTCVTGQHKDLVQPVLDFFGVKIDLDLKAYLQANSTMQSPTLLQTTSTLMGSIEKVLAQENPDWLVIHGDTTSTFCSSLSGFYRKVRIAHIEAGLRSFDLDSPWPEEANRRMTAVLASLHLAPTKAAQRNLIREHVDSKTVFVTGNTVVDALFYARQKWISSSEGGDQTTGQSTIIPTILVTCHRRENIGEPMERLAQALREIAEKQKYRIVFVMHKNPMAQEPFKRLLSGLSNVELREPMTYLDFTQLLSQVSLIVTDSGGIQEEALVFGKPVILCRTATERPEGIKLGQMELIGDKFHLLDKKISSWLKKKIKPSRVLGDGRASERIVKLLKKHAVQR